MTTPTGADLVARMAALVDLELEPMRAEQVARHLDGLLGDANAMSRFVDERPGLLPFRAPR